MLYRHSKLLRRLSTELGKPYRHGTSSSLDTDNMGIISLVDTAIHYYAIRDCVLQPASCTPHVAKNKLVTVV